MENRSRRSRRASPESSNDAEFVTVLPWKRATAYFFGDDTTKKAPLAESERGTRVGAGISAGETEGPPE